MHSELPHRHHRLPRLPRMHSRPQTFKVLRICRGRRSFHLSDRDAYIQGSPAATLICVDTQLLLHLQQICSGISRDGCNRISTGGPDLDTVKRHFVAAAAAPPIRHYLSHKSARRTGR